jgi:hypothetical protein
VWTDGDIDAAVNGKEPITLNGTGTSDPFYPLIDLDFEWTDGVSIWLGISPTILLDVGVHTLTLTVTNPDGWTDTSTVTITINPGALSVDSLTATHTCSLSSCPTNPPTTSDTVTFSAEAVTAFPMSDFIRQIHVDLLSDEIGFIPFSCTGGNPCFTAPTGPYAEGETVIYYAIFFDAATGLEVKRSATKSFIVTDNKPPVVSITAPLDGSTFTAGDSITFTATALDPEDGDIKASLSWTSSKDGVIGSGGSFSKSSLSVGTHTITAFVTDSGGLDGSDSITITINPAPFCSDPDGLDTSVKGTCTDLDGPVTDSCSGTSVVEKKCSAIKTCISSVIACDPTKECVGGKCVAIPASCGSGNGIVDAGEACDASAPVDPLNGQTCVSQGFPLGGTLACDASCTGFDTSGCISPPPCGALGQDCCASGDPCSGDLVCNGDTNKCESPLPPPPIGKPGGLVPCGRLIDIGTPNENCTFCHFFILFKNILDFIMWILAPILGVLFIVLGGFLILTSRGSPTQFNQGKLFIIWALLGFAIMLIAWILINSVFSVLKLQDWTGLKVGEWWQVSCNVPVPPPAVTCSSNPAGCNAIELACSAGIACDCTDECDTGLSCTGGVCTPSVAPIGCTDGIPDQDFGVTSAGKKVWGCDGVVSYASAGTLCEAGWHTGDVVTDSGLKTILETIGSGSPFVNRWIYMNGDPGSRTGRTPYPFGHEDCWGTPLGGTCSPVATPNDSRPIHIHSGFETFNGAYYNGILVGSNNIKGDESGAFSASGAICVEN